MNTELMFSSKTEEWATPQLFFDELNAKYNFTLDPCADETNHKCERFFTKQQNGLEQSWDGETVFCNPPYGRKTTPLWVKKCYTEVHDGNCPCVVALLPARTDTRWFHQYINHKAEVDFIKGRLKFGDGKNPAPFPSMVVVFQKEG